jgi:hypothetical protein
VFEAGEVRSGPVGGKSIGDEAFGGESVKSESLSECWAETGLAGVSGAGV